jgi:hypothetical protein
MNPSIALKVKSFHNMLDPSAEPAAMPVVNGLEVDLENRIIKFMAQTEAVDCEDQVVLAAGAKPEYFFKNRRIFIDHEYSVRHHVGTLKVAVPSNGKGPTRVGAKDHVAWWIKIHILPNMKDPLCDDILTMAKYGGIGTSIGYDRRGAKVRKATAEDRAKYGRDGKVPTSIMYEWPWIEQTITAMPCNGECQSIDAGKAAIIEDLLGKAMIRRESAALVGLPVKPKRKIIINMAAA